jgi:hypothetical protein
MKKVKACLVTGILAAAVGVGALASAPSAAAMPNQGLCESLDRKAKLASDLGTIWRYVGDHNLALYYLSKAAAYQDAAADCWSSL